MAWLNDYLDYTDVQESPKIFRQWMGLSLIASVMNRRAWMIRREHGVTLYKIFPGQLMLLLVGGSALARKTSALYIPEQFLGELGIQLLPGGKGSTEGFIKAIASSTGTTAVASGSKIVAQPNDSIFTIYNEELSNLLSKSTYAEAIVDLLCQLYDARDFPYRLSGGTIWIRNPCLTLVGCTTPETLGEALPARAHSAGLLSRIISVYSTKGEVPHAFADVDDQDVNWDEVKRRERLREKLLEGLRTIQALEGAARFTKKGKAWYIDWYSKWFYSPEALGEGYPGRRHDHLTRVSLLLNASSRFSLELDDKIQEVALSFLEEVEQGFPLAYRFIGESAASKKQERILELLRLRGGFATGTDVFRTLRRFFDSQDDLVKTINFLKSTGEVWYEVEQTTNEEIWHLTKLKPA